MGHLFLICIASCFFYFYLDLWIFIFYFYCLEEICGIVIMRDGTVYKGTISSLDFPWSFKAKVTAITRFQVPRLSYMNLVLEQVTGLLSYPVHLMKPKRRRAFSKHLFSVDHHDNILSLMSHCFSLRYLLVV